MLPFPFLLLLRKLQAIIGGAVGLQSGYWVDRLLCLSVLQRHESGISGWMKNVSRGY